MMNREIELLDKKRVWKDYREMTSSERSRYFDTGMTVEYSNGKTTVIHWYGNEHLEGMRNGTLRMGVYAPEDNPFFLKADDMPESENPSTVENTAVGKSEYGQKTPQSENPHTGKSATAVGKPEYGQKPLNSPQSENPHTENPTQTKIERKIERYKKENLSKEKENRSASSVIGKIQSQIGFEFLLKEHPDDEQLLRLISRVIAEKLLSEDASITSKNFKYSSDEVHECFETLDFNHIEYLLECLKKNLSLEKIASIAVISVEEVKQVIKDNHLDEK